MSQINVATARSLTGQWDRVRGDSQAVQAILQPYHFFRLDDHFDWTDFIIPGVVTRGYLGYNGPSGGGYDPQYLQLILINAHKDTQLANGDISEAYIYTAAYAPSNIPVPGPVQNDVKIMRWTQDYLDWCNAVVPAGMTRVFDIPLFDVLKQVPLGTDKNLEVFFALHVPQSNPQLQVDLVTYHPETGRILNMDDFTSPKPPFGSTAQEATYGLFS